MKMFNQVVLASMVIGSCAQAAQMPKHIFYMIGDGMATSQRQVAEFYMQAQQHDASQKLAVNSLPVTGIITTYSSSSLVTDSAAAGTALACGVKTDNGVIAQTPDGKELRTILEALRDKGYATGLVTTTRLTHATPAAFATHDENRNNENEIAEDYVTAGVDYMAGGGYRHFSLDAGTKRKDGHDLVKALEDKGYTTFIGGRSVDDFRSWKPKSGEKVLVLPTKSHLPYEMDRVKTNDTPSLAELTVKGIELLSKDRDGFFMMVEGGRIDHASHANDIAGTVGDTLAFDVAVKSALEFYRQHPKDTLIIVAGDHETGGLGLGLGKNYFLNLDKLSQSHESIEDKLQGVYKGDKSAFYKHIAETFELSDLSDEEHALIETAMKNSELSDMNSAENKKLYGGYDPVAMAVAHITSTRAGIYWTSYAHTATQLPISAIGVGAEAFMGFKDNTEVATTLATLTHVKIGR
jgi:alkaline phosphatase